jgi:diguanylate cyclase (GGDEF)-like protein
MSTEIFTSHEALMQFLYRAPIGLIQTTLDGSVEMINPMSASLLMPLSPTGNLDNLFDVLERTAPQLRELAAGFDQPSGMVCEGVRLFLATQPGGSTMPSVLSISLVKLDGARLMAMLSDATLEVQREQSELARGLIEASRTDRLTQMPNREVVRDRIQQILDRSHLENDEQFAVLFMNCDRFTQINDSLGHAAGDEVLGLVADRLRFSVRQRSQTNRVTGSGETAARIGSDEFVVFLNNLRVPEDVPAIAQRLLDSLCRPYTVGSHRVHLSVSIGIVLQAEAAGNAEVVLQDARIAMMEAKRAGGSCFVVFESAMQERAARLGGLETDLRRAIAEHELFVMYQPVVDLQECKEGGGCAGVEALVRWRHPTRGIVPPFEFITAAEECGLISAIGEFVLDTACHQFVKWQQELGPRAPRTLAVNLSRAQLTRPGFIDVLKETLLSSGLPSCQLQLEVTESLAAQDKTVQTRLHDIKALGVTLALDDFGTGFSSLASLHLLPVNTVKIDRSFVIQADTSSHHYVLIKATVLVANSLNMSTVAEGIETAAQAEVVRELGCEKGQGYFFSKPLLSSEITDWLVCDRVACRASAKGLTIV